MARSQVEFEMSRGARPLLAAGLALALTACAGARLPPPQASAAVPALWVDCRGEPSGGPTVVLEAGAEKIARELAATLDRLGETGPVVLAGHSNGGVYAEAFAILFPQRTAGVLYINAVGTDDLDSPLVMSELRDEEQRARLAVIGGRLGLAGMVAPRIIAEMGLPPGAARQKFLALTSDHHRLNSREEVLQIIPSLRRIRALGNVSASIPTAAIVSTWPPETPTGAAWRAAETAPARRACQGWALVAPGGTHVSPLGRDRAYALAAVRWLQTPGLKTDPVCTGPQFRG
jgi:pimeloyl-ACP methyl ester carboxylesterase